MNPGPLFLSAARVKALAAFSSQEADSVSLHLAVDGGGMYPSTFNQHAAEARRDPAMKMLDRDVDLIEKFVTTEFVPGQHRLAAVYSCAKRGLFETFALAAGCELYRVVHDARFDSVCRIGAELKVAVDRPAPATAARALRGVFAMKDGRPSPLRSPRY